MLVNLGLASQAPFSHRPLLATIRLDMQQPRPDGLSSRDEFDVLSGVEDALATVVRSSDMGLYVGRCTVAGCRIFYFYISDEAAWLRGVHGALSGFSTYRFHTAVCDDPAWSVYLDFLHPSDAERQGAMNLRVCDALRDHGDQLTQPREIRHWAGFPTAGARDSVVEAAMSSGFHNFAGAVNTKAGNDHAMVSRADVPACPGINAVTLNLFDLAKRFGGKCDGWETDVISTEG